MTVPSPEQREACDIHPALLNCPLPPGSCVLWLRTGGGQEVWFKAVAVVSRRTR
jgi:hypothetical protein